MAMAFSSDFSLWQTK